MRQLVQQIRLTVPVDETGGASDLPEVDGTWSRIATRDLCPFACHLKASLFASWTTKARQPSRARQAHPPM
eukprot:SAG22_NODE_16173_length_331_cov_1.064655_1_plen_70_part_10